MTWPSPYCLLVYHQILWHRNSWSATHWKPSNRVFLEEGPGGDDDQECESGAAEGNIDGKLDILEDVTDNEGDELSNTNVRKPVLRAPWGMLNGNWDIHRQHSAELWRASQPASGPQSPSHSRSACAHATWSLGFVREHTICPSTISRTWSRSWSAMIGWWGRTVEKD